MAADEFLWQPSNTSRAAREPRVNGIQYGDGYAQESPDGLNNNPLNLDLVFRNVNQTDIATPIDEFLSSKKGSISFLWTPPAPFATQRRFKCKVWDFVWEGGVIMGVTARFEEKFQL